jgi:hypothetical protein
LGQNGKAVDIKGLDQSKSIATLFEVPRVDCGARNKAQWGGRASIEHLVVNLPQVLVAQVDIPLRSPHVSMTGD